ncbi:hypothetical protein SPRG_07311 [Saprolegnia parasitica CBS 223.65]|uniref:HSF-type DNA-binding domain-containing protein n=1 Tax=Saprolegnia parasitica (strain CBS 223.65) TaxID=695850 RepID=A0A067CLN4_SAPPC|nr:hypothetical protein SPRG_07311 [Saprolegnia parasitica CBS 223.65]KDO27682.1 hypothetical protein SPRG_07311 [Saprolegnia parasitica CBS 223.65]|eukprot:XP_012201493.1 hypothetical protein SPRG_07311 [Saprolegnia parasitica CBS 223.65]
MTTMDTPAMRTDETTSMTMMMNTMHGSMAYDADADALGNGNATGSFVTKLFAMVETEPDSVVTWIREGTAFCIVQPKVLAETYLPKYFRHGRFSSLIRQLNFYSFYKVTEGSSIIYQHTHFRQGRPDLLPNIKRRGAGKAKDPWVDPLSSKQRYDTDAPGYTSGSVNPTASGMPGRDDQCSSPLSKPLSGLQNPSMLLNDNMSPALKPGMAPCVVPPMVDMHGRADLGKVMMKTMRPHHMAMSHAASIYGTGLGFQDSATNITLVPTRSADSMKPPLWKSPVESSFNVKQEMSFFTHIPYKQPTKQEMDENDVIDNAILDDLTFGDDIKAEPATDARPTVSVDPRSVVLSRNCLKLPTGIQLPVSAPTVIDTSMLFGADDDTWEVPLSPLNDPEDIPWLDLSF